MRRAKVGLLIILMGISALLLGSRKGRHAIMYKNVRSTFIEGIRGCDRVEFYEPRGFLSRRELEATGWLGGSVVFSSYLDGEGYSRYVVYGNAMTSEERDDLGDLAQSVLFDYWGCTFYYLFTCRRSWFCRT